jgi:hypothetical protein
MEKDPLSKYGPRLSNEEYEQCISMLYKDAAEGRLPATPGKLEQAIGEREFNLAIDYKLGTNFPEAKRKALLEAKRRGEKRRLRLVSRFIHKSIQQRAFADGMQVWLEQLADEFSKVLTPQELNAFMALEEGERPVFPIEPGKL